MKIILRLICLFLLVHAYSCSIAQNSATTIIILRHSEKDTVGKDPQLSIAGKERAGRIPTLFKDIKPDILYSTPYVRTRQTLKPWAEKTSLTIKDYDATNLAAFATELKGMQGKTIVVSGHSNTAPVLVNLLIGTNKYPLLNDNDYSKLWVVTLADGKATEKLVEY